jgi:L-amino acid N-acyltransferase YncA
LQGLDRETRSPRIRHATPGDASEIATIYNEAIEERSSTFETEFRSEDERRRWLSQHNAKHPALVAESDHDGKLVAWAALSPYRDRACYTGIGEFSIYVSKAFRGKGIGRVLLNKLIDEARWLGYWKVVSRIFVSNSASRELCRRCGFREVGIYEKHGKIDGKWVDTVIVERLISENLI